MVRRQGVRLVWSSATANPGTGAAATGAGRRWEKEKGLESGRGVATTLLVVSVSGLVLTHVLRAALVLGSWELGVGRLVLVLVLGSGQCVGPRLGGGRAGVVRARCGTKAGWTAKTSFGWWVVHVRGPSTTFRGLPCMLSFVSLASARSSDRHRCQEQKKTEVQKRKVEKEEGEKGWRGEGGERGGREGGREGGQEVGV